MAIVVPKIIQKYITVFPDIGSYNEAYSEFEEVNWSAVKDSISPEETAKDYYPSVRTTNRDNERKMVYYTNDNILKTFFLEILWGYSGWEWKDYELVISEDPDTGEREVELLKGGNLYKIKSIETVISIPDGRRLQHINDFLNSQTEVTTVESFDTDNLKAINRAFKRLEWKSGKDASDRKIPLLIKVYNFPNVVEADGLFENTTISVENNMPVTMPKVTSLDKLLSGGEYIDGFAIKCNALTTLTHCFDKCLFRQSEINLNDIFKEDTIKKVSNMKGFLQHAYFLGKGPDGTSNIVTVNYDLSSTECESIDLSYFAAMLYGDFYARGIIDRTIDFNLTFGCDVDLSYAFAAIMTNTYSASGDIPASNVHKDSPKKITLNFNNSENYIRNLDYAFTLNSFLYGNGIPVQRLINDNCSDNRIYQKCRFDIPVTYDFSPNHIINESTNQFSGSTLNSTYSFQNVDALKSPIFYNIKLGENAPTVFSFPIHNDNYTYNEDGSKYRTIRFEYSDFSGFTEQNFYLYPGEYDEPNGRIGGDGHYTAIFRGMKNVDFTRSQKLYIKDINVNIVGSTTDYVAYFLDFFQGCSSMTITPEVYLNANITQANQWMYLRTFMFEGCNNLVEINCDNVNIIVNCYGAGIQGNSFTVTSKQLEFFRFGRVNFSINLASKVLDIPTLETTLLRQDNSNLVNDKRPNLTLMKEVWEALSQNVQTHCIQHYRQIDIKEDSTY